MQDDIRSSQTPEHAADDVSRAAKKFMVAVMNSSSVVLSTVAGSGHWIFSLAKTFTDVIIDEAGQVTVPQSSIPLQHLQAKGAVTMIGGQPNVLVLYICVLCLRHLPDHKQIGPFVETPASYPTGTAPLLQKSIFEMLFTHNESNRVICHTLRFVKESFTL